MAQKLAEAHCPTEVRRDSKEVGRQTLGKGPTPRALAQPLQTSASLCLKAHM